MPKHFYNQIFDYTDYFRIKILRNDYNRIEKDTKRLPLWECGPTSLNEDQIISWLQWANILQLFPKWYHNKAFFITNFLIITDYFRIKILWNNYSGECQVMNFFKDFSKNSTLQGYFNITALEHITACWFSFVVAFTYRPARQFLGHPQQWDHHLQGFKSSRFGFFTPQVISAAIWRVFLIGASDMTRLRLVYNNISALVSAYSWHQEGFYLEFYKVVGLSNPPRLSQERFSNPPLRIFS